MGAWREAPARNGKRREIGEKWGGVYAGSSSSPSVSAPGASSHGNGDLSRLSLTKDGGVEYGDARSTSTSTSRSSLISRRAEGKRAWSAGGPVVLLSPPLYGPGAVSMCRASEMADSRQGCEIELSDGEGKDGAKTGRPPLGWREGSGVGRGNPMLLGLVCAAQVA